MEHLRVGGRSTGGDDRIGGSPETRKPPRSGGFGENANAIPRPPSCTGGTKIARRKAGTSASWRRNLRASGGGRKRVHSGRSTMTGRSRFANSSSDRRCSISSTISSAQSIVSSNVEVVTVQRAENATSRRRRSAYCPARTHALAKRPPSASLPERQHPLRRRQRRYAVAPGRFRAIRDHGGNAVRRYPRVQAGSSRLPRRWAASAAHLARAARNLGNRAMNSRLRAS